MIESAPIDTASAAGRVVAIIPTFNRADYLPEAIQGVLHQTWPPARVLVVDDGSTDGTAAVVASFGGCIEYFRKENGGKSSALNLALRLVEEELVWIFDDDDVAAPEALERMQTALGAAPEAGFAYGSYVIFTEAGGARTMIDPGFPRVAPDEIFTASLGRSFIHQPGLLVRRSCYDAVGPFDETLVRSQDYEMMLRLARRFRGVEAPGPLFFQRRHAGVRGSASLNVRAADIEATWTRFDQSIIRRFHETVALGEYLPGHGGPAGGAASPLTDRERFAALLRRCTIAGRKGLWDLAAADLASAAELSRAAGIERLAAVEARGLEQMFDLFSSGAVGFLDSAPFARALAAMSANRSLSRDVRLSMSAGLPYRIRLAAESRQGARLLMLARIYLRLVRPGEAVASLVRRLTRRGGAAAHGLA